MGSQKEYLFIDNPIDEVLLPNALLSPDSLIKKKRLNHEIDLFLNMQLTERSIALYMLLKKLAEHIFINHKLYIEKLHHKRELENFFKNIAIFNMHTNVPYPSKNEQKNWLFLNKRKLEEYGIKIDSIIIKLMIEIMESKQSLLTLKREMNNTIQVINHYFDKIIMEADHPCLTLTVDLNLLTGKSLGMLEINSKSLQKIITEVKNHLDEHIKTNKEFNLQNTFQHQLTSHLTEEIKKIDPTLSCPKEHPILQHAVEEIIEKGNTINDHDINKIVENYQHTKHSITEKEKEIKAAETKQDKMIETKKNLEANQHLITCILEEERNEIDHFDQLATSIDILISDVKNKLIRNFTDSDKKTPLEQSTTPKHCQP